ncbi:hypothetical protein BH10BAC5_BH10BAC5_11100 [soil metagenome]
MIKKFAIRFLIFSFAAVLLFSLYAVLGTKALEYRNGPGTSEIITRQFNNAITHNSECYVLGNSRSFRGINPEKFSMSTFNFSGNGESYDLMYYKLKFILEHNGKFKYLILGTDFFQFAFNSIDKNWNYGDYFGNEFRSKYPSANRFYSYFTFMMGPLQGLNNTLGVFNSIRLYLLSKPVKVNRLKDNGQYLQEQRLSSDNMVERDDNKLSEQIIYFEKILQTCRENGVEVFITLLPAQSNELKLYENKKVKADFDEFIKSYTNECVIYIDNFDLNIFEEKDWLDVNHLTPSGADKYSSELNNEIWKITKSVLK